MEILLFCIEINQYHKHMKPFMANNKDDNVKEIEFQNIPISETVHTDEDNTDSDEGSYILSANTQANKLFVKYIENGSEYEINISGTMRDELSELIGDLDDLLSNDSIDLDALYTVFEQSVQEMMTLQSISFERFKQSETFCDVKALLMNATKQTFIKSPNT